MTIKCYNVAKHKLAYLAEAKIQQITETTIRRLLCTGNICHKCYRLGKIA